MSMTITQVKDPISGELIDYAIIDHGNGEFTSMPKSTYDTLVTESAPTA